METVDIIVQLVHSHGMTGTSLGKLLGLKKSPLTDWKNKKSKPTASQIQKMSEIFNVSIDYLLGKSEIKNKPTTQTSDELMNELLQDPLQKEIYDRLIKLNREHLELALAQLDVMLKHQDNQDK